MTRRVKRPFVITCSIRGQRMISGLFLSAATSAALHWPLVLQAQSPEPTTPRFEVASIKQNKSGAVRAQFRPEPGRLTVTNFSLKFIIGQAWGVKAYQIVGGPGWLDSDKYDIIAKAEGVADNRQVRMMLRPLLVERFNLVVHRETRAMPVYDLVVAKSGPRFPESKVGDPGPPSTAEDQVVRVLGPAPLFADNLSILLGRPVLDKTGISGMHNFTVVMKRDEPLSSNGDGGGLLSASSAPSSIFSALQEQLGLKLESKKGPVEVLVIDHLERPSEN
jgi:uncharacterized protein (TIGR03435 family)